MASSMPDHLIKVTGFTRDNSSEKTFRQFFSNPQYCGVQFGTIQTLEVKDDVAYLLYEHRKDAESVVKHGQFKWGNEVTILCEWANTSAVTPSHTSSQTSQNRYTARSSTSISSSVSDGATSVPKSGPGSTQQASGTSSSNPSSASRHGKPAVEHQPTKVVVSGFGQTHKQSVKLLFGQRQFHPDDMEEVNVDILDAGYVFITYRNRSAADVLLQQQNLVFEGHNLTAKLYSNMPVYVEITGCPQSTHTQILGLFLRQENLGGQYIETINTDDFDLGVVLVKYKSFEGAMKLLQTKPLELTDSPLQATILQQSDVECRQVLVEGFKSTVHPQTMDMYIKHVGGNDVSEINMDGIKEGRVIVKFKSQKGAEDFAVKPLSLEDKELQTRLMKRRDLLKPSAKPDVRPKESAKPKKKKKKQHDSGDEEVGLSSDDPNFEELSRTVVVSNTPQGIHKQEVELVFDDTKLGGGDIEEWNWDWFKDYGMVVIVYKSQKAADTLTKKKKVPTATLR